MSTSKTIHLRLLWCLLSAAPAWAAEIPKALPADSRLREVVYDRNQVFKITVRKGVATHIVLDPKEKIISAAPGFGADCEKPELLWCIVANAGSHTIHIKPKAAAIEPNNLELTTDKRLYSFDFVISNSKDRDADSMFRVMFQYPDDVARETAKEHAIAEGKIMLTNRLNTKNEPKNWNYAMQMVPGADSIAPSMAYDDGRFTYLKFPAGREMPEIFAVATDGAESQVNSHIEDNDTIVLHRVYKRLVLRLSNQVIGIWNDAYESEGIAPSDGVTVKGLKRVMRGQK